MATDKKTENKSLWDNLFDGITSTIRQAQRSKKKRLNKMKAITAHDSAESKRDEAELAIQEHYKKIAEDKDLDWKFITEKDAEAEAAAAAMTSIERRYKEVFGESLNKTM